MADDTENELPTAENSGKSRRKPPKGRPFVKGQSGNPGGRPKTSPEFRSKNREAADVFLEALVKKALADKLTFEQLAQALADASTRGGFLTDAELVDIEAKRLRTLSDVLAGQNLTEAQRTKIIDDFHARLTASTEPKPV